MNIPIKMLGVPAAEAQLVERAGSLAEIIRANAPASEDARSLSPETLRAMREAGLFRALQPEKFGGTELSPLSLCRAVFEVGRADMSAGWVLFVLGLHQYAVAMMGPKACEEIWGDQPDALVASSVSPFGQVTRVEGGYVVNGCWRFSSGVDHAEWVGVGGMVDLPGGKKDFRFSILSTKDIRIDHESWKVFGLAGTGSKSFVVENVFVPDHRSMSLFEATAMSGQSDLPRAYRYPFWCTFNALVGAANIGGALGALDEAVRQMQVREGAASAASGKQLAMNDPFVRARVGRANTLLRSCVARYDAVFAEMDGFIDRGEAIPVAQRMQYLVDFSQCARDCEEAVITLYKATGARGAAIDNRMQAIMRNVLVGTNHIAMNLDPQQQIVGGMLMGGEVPEILASGCLRCRSSE